MAIESTSKMKCKSCCVSYTTRLSLVSSIYDPLALFYRNTMQQMRLVISAFLQRGKSVAEMAKHSRLQIATFLHRRQLLRIRRHRHNRMQRHTSAGCKRGNWKNCYRTSRQCGRQRDSPLAGHCSECIDMLPAWLHRYPPRGSWRQECIRVC